MRGDRARGYSAALCHVRAGSCPKRKFDAEFVAAMWIDNAGPPWASCAGGLTACMRLRPFGVPRPHIWCSRRRPPRSALGVCASAMQPASPAQSPASDTRAANTSSSHARTPRCRWPARPHAPGSTLAGGWRHVQPRACEQQAVPTSRCLAQRCTSCSRSNCCASWQSSASDGSSTKTLQLRYTATGAALQRGSSGCACPALSVQPGEVVAQLGPDPVLDALD
jgi:hypothetical protein